MTESSGGQILYQLPHPRRDGSTHLLLDPLELIEQLSVLIPPPRFHLLRCHGVLAPRAQLRAAVVPRSTQHVALGGGPAPRAAPPEPQRPPPSRAGRLSWAALMRRVFQVDVLRCRRSAATVVDFPKYGTRLVQKHGTPKRELSPLRDELKLTQAGRRAEAVGREISADERTVVELARPVSGGREERGEDGFRYGPVLSTRAFIPATLGRSR